MINFTIFLVLIAIVCFLLVVVIMVQNPKGGGLSSTFGASQTLGGVQKTTDFLDKSTWTLATILVVLILLSSLSFSSGFANDSLTDDSDVPAATTETPAPINPADNTAAPATNEVAPATPTAE
ncbi:preprotein translocase subunit SecG [Flavobacterium rhizosphaerae]|uniref:Protein-export membrane protein SecG n=1 Tax=Flavobacterium rhizosphaerae TaxID=3163298 RepID=A0ABW8YU45_9FLAO